MEHNGVSSARDAVKAGSNVGEVEREIIIGRMYGERTIITGRQI
jgi:hypothetical protein